MQGKKAGCSDSASSDELSAVPIAPAKSQRVLGASRSELRVEGWVSKNWADDPPAMSPGLVMSRAEPLARSWLAPALAAEVIGPGTAPIRRPSR